MPCCKTCNAEKIITEFYIRKDTGRARSQCKTCWNIKVTQWAADNIEKRRAIALKWAKANYPSIRANKAKYRAQDPLRMRRWCIENPEAMSALRHNWKSKNKPKILADVRRRQAAKLKATPAWANSNRIESIYSEAARLRLLGHSVEVDHVVPLRSKFVCGFHCEANLEIVPAGTNRKKSNRIWPDMPESLR